MVVQVTIAGSGDAFGSGGEWTMLDPPRRLRRLTVPQALLDAAHHAQLCLLVGYSPTPVRWHLDLDSLSRHRDRFDCGRMVLTHLSPTALAMDLSDWEVADDGLRLTV